MATESIFSDYDRFAWFYNLYWGGEFSRPALSLYNSLLYPHLPPSARVLDLCCGTGQIAHGVSEQGYRVTGIDGSEAMLKFARKNAPAVEFLQADARAFTLPGKVHAVISAFDSLNHIMRVDELKMVFRNVHAVLEKDGIFLFDLNLEDENDIAPSAVDIVEEDHVCVVRASYNPKEKLKRYDATMFRLEDGQWRRSDLTLYQQYYENEEVLSALAECGFARVKAYDARREFGFTVSDGRMFYFARM
ncbi:MAG: class I SAM-dependent methyltransferase [Blastocatellia bacterium]